MLKRLHVNLLLLSITCLVILVGCSNNAAANEVVSVEPISRTEFMMGTAISITLYDSDDESILDAAFERLDELENDLSLNLEDTLLINVNSNAGIEPTSINDDMYNIIERSLYYSELTAGSFDISIGPIVTLWNIGLPDARVPSPEEIEAALPLVDYTKVELLEDEHAVYLETPGMQLDLGSIAKGYAADEMVTLLSDYGVNHAIIDLGGNIFTMGTKVDGSSWKIGIQDPLNPRGQIVGHIPTVHQSIVTSGIYERYLEVDDIRYHHLLDPETGYPFDNEIAGVTIVSELSMDGDALSTAVFSKGVDEGIEFVESLDDIDAIFITKSNEVYVTEGLKEDFVLTNSNFTLVE